jgi:hypothetical protein
MAIQYVCNSKILSPEASFNVATHQFVSFVLLSGYFNPFDVISVSSPIENIETCCP